MEPGAITEKQTLTPLQQDIHEWLVEVYNSKRVRLGEMADLLGVDHPALVAAARDPRDVTMEIVSAAIGSGEYPVPQGDLIPEAESDVTSRPLLTRPTEPSGQPWPDDVRTVGARITCDERIVSVVGENANGTAVRARLTLGVALDIAAWVQERTDKTPSPTHPA